MREQTVQILWGRTFQAEGTANTEYLMWELCTLCVRNKEVSLGGVIYFKERVVGDEGRGVTRDKNILDRLSHGKLLTNLWVCCDD